MTLDKDMDLMKIVGGPDFVRDPTVGPSCDPGRSDTSEVTDDAPTSLPHDSSL